MRQKRIILKNEISCYHVISHLCGGEKYLEDLEKEVLRKQIWATVDCCGLELLSYCIMSNHFHLLIRVPQKIDFSDKELIRRYRRLYGQANKYQMKTIDALSEAMMHGGKSAKEARAYILKGMGDLSLCIKLIKQRFSIWYNKIHDRKGTLWSERFKSVLVENSVKTLLTVSAYIDLNPIRSGLVENPEDYRFCSYAELVAGNREAIKSFRSLFNGMDLKYALRDYLVVLFGKGSKKKRADGSGEVIDRDKVHKVLINGGKMESYKVLRCRIRYFSDGCILGSAAFVNQQKAVLEKSLSRDDKKENAFSAIKDNPLSLLKSLRGENFC